MPVAVPYVFKSESELITALRRGRTRSLANKYFDERIDTLGKVVSSAVASNTYRAFRNLPVRPSDAFRNWAESHIQKRIPPFSRVPVDREYSAYIHASALALCRHWQKVTGTEMGYGRGAKLFNLVLKRLACLSSLSQRERRALIHLQHVPLDSYTLIGLRAVAPDLSIPKSATMRWIQTPQQYSSFQERIATIAQKAQAPAIYYDILAWDMRHDA